MGPVDIQREVRGRAPLIVVVLTWGVSVAMVAFLTISGLSLKIPGLRLVAPRGPSPSGPPVALPRPPANPSPGAALPAEVPHPVSVLPVLPPPPILPPPPVPTPCRTTPDALRLHHRLHHGHDGTFGCTVPQCIWHHRCHRRPHGHGRPMWLAKGDVGVALRRLWWINDAWPGSSGAGGPSTKRHGSGHAWGWGHGKRSG